MKAVGYQKPQALSQPDALIDITLPDPVTTGRDLLVEVKAVSVNPVDTKVRASSAPAEGQTYKVLGWDASGIVKAVGPDVTLFKPGDRVWYAGSIARPGTNSELHLVDERIVGHAPKSLDFAQAAALPLTAITAWEMLFDRLAIAPGKQPCDKTLLVIGASGGVGSIMVQLARLTSLTRHRHRVAPRNAGLGERTRCAPRDRPQSADCRRAQAHRLSDRGLHRQPDAGRCPPGADRRSHRAARQVRPDRRSGRARREVHAQGGFHSLELMFTRSLLGTDDMIGQHRLLNEVAGLVDAGLVRTTLAECFGTIDARILKRAHALIESGKARGKVVLEGWR